jgi:hypothetical protein
MNTRSAAVHKDFRIRQTAPITVDLLNLVTVAQRGYSCALLAVYGAKFAGGCLFAGTARPPDTLGHTVRKAVSQGL